MSPPEDSDKAEIYVEVSEEIFEQIIHSFTHFHYRNTEHRGKSLIFLSFFTNINLYLQGKRRNVDGFIRWCSKGSKKIGLSQALEVVEVFEENPTGLYDDFYVKTKMEEESAGPN